MDLKNNRLNKGQTLIEFALVISFMMFTILWIIKFEMIYSRCTTLDMDVCFCTALAKVNCKLIEQMKDFNYKKQYSFLLPIHIERESVVLVTFPG